MGLVGAFTDTCAERHVPAYLEHYNDFKAKGVDESWCVAVNDGFAMGAFGNALGSDVLVFGGTISFAEPALAASTAKMLLELARAVSGEVANEEPRCAYCKAILSPGATNCGACGAPL